MRHDGTVYSYDWWPARRWQWQCSCGGMGTDLATSDDAIADWRAHHQMSALPESPDGGGDRGRLLLEVRPSRLGDVR